MNWHRKVQSRLLTRPIWSLLSSRLNPFAKLANSDVQRIGNPENRLNAGIANTSLNAADVSAVEISLFGEGILGNPALVPYAGNISSEGG